MRKVRKAAALKYENGYSAPIVTAAGIGYIADKIIEKAEENDVAIVKDESLAEMLSKIDIGDSIPPDLYEAVAKIIVFVNNIDSRENK